MYVSVQQKGESLTCPQNCCKRLISKGSAHLQGCRDLGTCSPVALTHLAPLPIKKLTTLRV